ncbi:unnamed protein product [Dimorphilus gyrociliatus]|uniref:BTB domain-containing protein n=1 Tax=Dimorphilus gyrociliatus TaxID=2664684 RepID=A0A7I8V8S0_9ANNE|nr:unnamed protein product [Dimorphilus gyrociliatus]
MDMEIISINVGGSRHDTLADTLLNKPGTTLCQLARKHLNGTCRKKEYFFDRHPGVFSTVMDYYRSGELHVPLDVCGAVVKRELNYWQVDERLIEPCCWISYSSYIDNQKTLSDFTQSVAKEQAELDTFNRLAGWRRTQARIWMLLDHPRSSRWALIYAVTSFIFVLTSIMGFCLETLPEMRQVRNDSKSHCNRTSDIGVAVYTTHPLLEYVDYVCTAFFTLELIIRVVFAPNKLEFFKSPMNIIDILALLPLYAQIVLDWLDHYKCFKNDRAVIETIFILRIVRIFRIFHLVKHYKALKILVHAIRASIQELLMLLIFIFIAMLVFSTLIFYAERPSQSKEDLLHFEGETKFRTIPLGFWWSIITMTTVGYGDMFPKTGFGCVVGSMCAFSGVLLLALTVPVISNNFALFYTHARSREQIIAKQEGFDEAADDASRKSVSIARSKDTGSEAGDATVALLQKTNDTSV